MLTQDELKNIGCRYISWNNGAFCEWWLPVKGAGRGLRDSRLGVRFNEHPDDPVKVYLICPSTMVRLQHVTTIDDFLTMYRLLTGKQKKLRKSRTLATPE